MRHDKREFNQLREIKLTPGYIKHPEGSVLVEFGDTKVICNASVTEGVPPFLRDTGKGWITAEYEMLPRSTHTRSSRESVKGKRGGRTHEISRLIGRSLRASVDMDRLGEITVVIDCDVIQADGGTRTAAITGGCAALYLALKRMKAEGVIDNIPFLGLVSAVSVGVVSGGAVLDLDYIEDSAAEVDMNIVARDDGTMIEVQGSGEKGTFDRDMLNRLLDLAEKGTAELFEIQKEVMGL